MRAVGIGRGVLVGWKATTAGGATGSTVIGTKVGDGDDWQAEIEVSIVIRTINRRMR
jgi:hypothetical protein